MRRDEMGIGIGIALVVVLVISAIGGGIASYKNSEREVTTLVRSKERVCSRDDCKYTLFTEAGTFQVTDTILYSRFDTSDVYGAIEPQKRYTLKVVGWRLPLFSTYPNVLKASEAK